MMFVKRKMKDVDMVTGERMPRKTLVQEILSRLSVTPTRSDLTRAIAMSFSSGESQRAVSGRSVMVKKAMIASPQVMMPSTAKIIRQLRREPTLSSVRMADASSPPKAPAKDPIAM